MKAAIKATLAMLALLGLIVGLAFRPMLSIAVVIIGTVGIEWVMLWEMFKDNEGE